MHSVSVSRELAQYVSLLSQNYPTSGSQSINVTMLHGPCPRSRQVLEVLAVRTTSMTYSFPLPPNNINNKLKVISRRKKSHKKIAWEMCVDRNSLMVGRPEQFYNVQTIPCLSASWHCCLKILNNSILELGLSKFSEVTKYADEQRRQVHYCVFPICIQCFWCPVSLEFRWTHDMWELSRLPLSANVYDWMRDGTDNLRKWWFLFEPELSSNAERKQC